MFMLLMNIRCVISNCTVPDAQAENVTFREKTNTTFSYELNKLKGKVKEKFRIEVKVCEAKIFYTVCRCRWVSSNNPICKNQGIDSTCEARHSEMRVSLLVTRSHSTIVWELLEQDSSPVVLKHTNLQVTYPPVIRQLSVDGKQLGESYIVDENQGANISCFFIHGHPSVDIHLIDDIGHMLISDEHDEGSLTMSLGVFHCHDMWPTIRCEAPGSELNRSVALLVKCLPRFTYMAAQVFDLKQALWEGLVTGLKYYSNKIKACHITKMSPPSKTKEVKCDLKGWAPDFNLTIHLAKESWIGEGFFTLIVRSDDGDSSMTFELINKTRSRGGNAQNETTNGNEGERTSKKSDSSTSSPGQAAGNGSKSGGSTPRSSSSGSDKPSTNPNYTSTALQEVEIHPYMDLHTRDPTYASTTSSKDPHMYMELKTLRAESKSPQQGSGRNGNDGYETPRVPGQGNQSSDGYETPQPPREERRRSALYANQGRSDEPIQEEVNYYNEA